MKGSACRNRTHSLIAWLSGDLSPEESAELSKHLQTCRGCREEAEDLRGVFTSLRQLPDGRSPRIHRSFRDLEARIGDAFWKATPRPVRRWLPPALVFGLAASVALLLIFVRVSHREPDDRAARSSLIELTTDLESELTGPDPVAIIDNLNEKDLRALHAALKKGT